MHRAFNLSSDCTIRLYQYNVLLKLKFDCKNILPICIIIMSALYYSRLCQHYIQNDVNIYNKPIRSCSTIISLGCSFSYTLLFHVLYSYLGLPKGGQYHVINLPSQKLKHMTFGVPETNIVDDPLK